MNLLPENFQGTKYRTADNWYQVLDVNKYQLAPMNYVEIGCFYGANLLSVVNSYASHPQSKLYAVDPWMDYSDYPEYKHQQNTIYDAFQHNLQCCEQRSKICVMRGFSHAEIPKLLDDNFDIIYIDGNHEPEYVTEDAVLSFRKLKVGGYLIFDDYGWGGPDLTQRGIDAFLSSYHKRIKHVSTVNSQVFCQKLC